jgi:HEAT repeat protein
VASKREIMALMVKYFPKCPICGAEDQYQSERVLLLTNFVRCRSCLALWSPMSFEVGKEMKMGQMQLTEPDKEGRASSLTRKVEPVAFWQSLDLESVRAEQEEEKRAKEAEQEGDRRAKQIEKLVDKLVPRWKWSREPLWPGDQEFREEILDELKEIGEPALERMIEMSRGDLSERLEAMVGLGTLGAIGALWLLEDGRAEQALIQGLKDEQPVVREKAAWWLGLAEQAKKGGKGIAPLVDALKNDESPNVRAMAAHFLGYVTWDRSGRVAQALSEAVNDRGFTFTVDDEGTRKASGFRVQLPASLALLEAGDEKAIATALPFLLRQDWFRPWVRSEWTQRGPSCSRSLKDAGQGAVKCLCEALKMDGWEERYWAARILGEIGNAQAVEALADALDDESDDVRSSAADALGEIGDPRAEEALTRASQDKKGSVRSAARRAVKRIRQKRSP